MKRNRNENAEMLNFFKTAFAGRGRMMLLILLLCLVFALPSAALGDGNGSLVAITEANFPDAAFRSYLASLDWEKDGFLNGSMGEARDIYVPDGVQSIQGIKLLSWITGLDWENCGLKAMAEPELPDSLEQLYLKSETLTRLDVSHLPNLRSLDLSGCSKLATLVMGSHPNLSDIDWSNTLIAQIDVSRCPKLDSICAPHSNISSLDVSQNPLLKLIWIWDTPIESLDLRNNPKLANINLAGCKNLAYLDISQNTELETLVVSDCVKLSELDITNKSKLTELRCENTAFPYLELSGCPELIYLSANDASLTSIDTSGNPKLEDLYLNNCPLRTLDVSHNPELCWLLAFQCGLDEIIFSPDANLKLERVDVRNNNFDTLELGYHPCLKNLAAERNHINSLDVSGLPALEQLWLQNTSLTSLDVSHNSKLVLLRCSETPLTEIDVSHNPELESLDVEWIFDLETLDVSHNPKLKELRCYLTKLRSLDLSHNPALEHIEAYDCQLSHLDLTACAQKPGYVSCYNNTQLVKLTNGKLDLRTLEGFDVSRASEWQGGTVNGTILTFQGNQVSYTYDCGFGITERFTLAVGGKTADGYSYLLRNDGTASITGCTKKGNIVLPETVDGYTVSCLTDNLFRDRYGVTSVTIPKTVTSLGPGGNLLTYVFSGCHDLKEVRVASGNPAFVDVDGVLYSKDMSTLYCYPCDKAGSEYHIPAQTTWIDCTVFAGINNLRHLYLENPDTGWAAYTFAAVDHLTVHYRKGGRAETRILQDIENGAVSEEGVYCPFYMSFGEEASGDSRVQEKAAEVIASVITPGMTDRQKAQALHDWIITHAHYSMKYDDELGILVYGEAHCQGYTRTYKLLLDMAGVENRIVEGYAKPSWAGHEWNQIKLGNIWYHVDCTWDDPTSGNNYDQAAVSGMERQDYFLLSTQCIAQDHGWDMTQEDLRGWAQEGSSMVFYDASGRKVTGWLYIDGGSFYFDQNGRGVTGTVEINGKTYLFVPRLIYTDISGDHYAGSYTKKNLPAANLVLPASLTVIEAEAFAGVKNKVILVPASVTSIASNAFDPSVTILCPAGSYAETRCGQLGLNVTTY